MFIEKLNANQAVGEILLRAAEVHDVNPRRTGLLFMVKPTGLGLSPNKLLWRALIWNNDANAASIANTLSLGEVNRTINNDMVYCQLMVVEDTVHGRQTLESTELGMGSICLQK